MKGSARDVPGLFHFRCVPGRRDLALLALHIAFLRSSAIWGDTNEAHVSSGRGPGFSHFPCRQSLCSAPKEFARNLPCDEFQAADSVPIEIEKVEGKHDDIADVQLPSPTTSWVLQFTEVGCISSLEPSASPFRMVLGRRVG
jgi:hypothetical protein